MGYDNYDDIGNVKKALKTVPDMPKNTSQKDAVDYVALVYQGVDRVDAFAQVFPHRYKKFVDKAKDDNRNVKKTVMYAVSQYENGKYLNSLFSAGNEHYFKHFISMKTNMLNEMYKVGMDEGNDMRDRLSASKIFLTHIPEPDKTINYKVEVSVEDTFAKKLEERQKQLYSIANNETDILDAEIDEE